LNDPELDQTNGAGAGPTTDEEQQQMAGVVQQEGPEESEVGATQ
jgi:hypothetical protein